MNNLESVVTESLNELERILVNKVTVGDKIEIYGYTIIPLMTVGFGFGAGERGGDEDKKSSTGSGVVGTGMGGGIKPAAIIIASANEVRLEVIPNSQKSSAFEQVSKLLMEKFSDKNLGSKLSQKAKEYKSKSSSQENKNNDTSEENPENKAE